MRHPSAVLAIALAVGIAVGCALVWEFGPPKPWSVERILFPTGSVLRVPEFQVVSFDVPPAGGVLVGAADVDHTSVSIVVAPEGTFFHCAPGSPHGYSGGPWGYSVNESLAAGQYAWGASCFGDGNITVTQPIEVLNP